MPVKEKVGLVGLGLMGSALGSNLIRAGFEVWGYDIAPARVREHVNRGGTAAASPAEVASGARFVMLSLLNSDIVREVCFGREGLATRPQEHLVVLDTTTARPEDSADIGERLAERGIGFLDATLSGTSTMAWHRDLVAMAGGDAGHFEKARPLLEAVAREVYHMGPPGSGARAKLIVNLVLGINRMALAEGLVLGMKSGMNPAVLLAVLKAGAAYSRAMEERGERMIEARYEPPTARIHQHHKDVRLMLEQGQKSGAPLLLTSVLQQVLQAAELGGLKDMDTAGVIEILRRLAGIPSS